MRWFLRRMFPPRLPKPKAKYVGFVHAFSRDTGADYRYDGFWILTEKAGERKAEQVGNALNSAFAISRQAAVIAWLAGGPLPPLGAATEGNVPPPKPRKSAPKKKTADNVVAFSRKAS